MHSSLDEHLYEINYTLSLYRIPKIPQRRANWLELIRPHKEQI
jgi:hypothetical protein